MKKLLINLRILLLHNSFYYILFIITTLFAFIYVNLYNHKSIYKITDTEFVFVIYNYKIDGNKLTFELKGKEKIIGNYFFESLEEKNNFFSSYSIGDIIKINGSLKKPKNNTIPNTFNYKKYLKNKKIYYTLNIESFSKIKNNKNIFFKLKNFVYKRVHDIKNNEYIYALVLGESLYINTNNYRHVGVSHLFALSGLHVSIMTMLIIKLVKLIKKVFKLCEEESIKLYIVLFIFLLMFSFVTGFKPSFLKAMFLFLLVGLNKVYYFYIKTSNLIILVYFILVIINPFFIFDLGFLLSLTITYFIVFASEFIKVRGYFTKSIFTSLISLLASIPILINSFYIINFISLISNLIFIPFVSFIIYPLSLLTFIFPFLNKLLLFFTKILELITAKFLYFKFLNISFPKVSIIFIIIYYIFLILLIVNNKRFKYIVMIILLLAYGYYKNSFNKSTNIYFLDVSQGDSALIVTPNKYTILIDTGGVLFYEQEEWMRRTKNFDLMENNIIPFFRSIGVNKIDYLFLTHADADHSGYALSLVDNFEVKNIIINNGDVTSVEKQLNYKHIEDKYIIDNLIINSLNSKIYSTENDNSIVLLVTIENKKLLFMGDASEKQEKEIMENNILNDIFLLKVGHHGSKTSSCKEFIDFISPKYSIISVGENNKFGHPNKEVLNRLKKSNIYRTDKDGTINFKFDINEVNIFTYLPY